MMDRNSVKYVSQVSPQSKAVSRTETKKLDWGGYCYRRRKTGGSTSYWHCDHDQVCYATVIEGVNGFRPGKNYAGFREHVAHPPNDKLIMIVDCMYLKFLVLTLFDFTGSKLFRYLNFKCRCLVHPTSLFRPPHVAVSSILCRCFVTWKKNYLSLYWILLVWA